MAKEHLYKSYVTSAATIIGNYDGKTPLNDFLKKYFALHKKYGSRDRKHITHLCYCYYRLGFAELGLDTEERILLALFLCSDNVHEIITELKPLWKENVTDSIQEKLQLVGYPFSIENIFPWQDELSEGIDATAFAESHLIQPDLFLRTRPNKNTQVIKKLDAAEISYTQPMEDCVAIVNNTKVDTVIELNKEAVVQDYSSQRIAEFYNIIKPGIKHPTSVWDCCAASGGKSILAYDVLDKIDITATDLRTTIIANLRERFREAGIKQYQSFVTDLTKPFKQHSKFDLIICDVPCSGSGTWGRTPEQLHFFSAEKIDYYSNLQKQIVQNVLPNVKESGYFLYVTCSVFKKENEAMVDFILANSKLQLIKKEVLIGYDKKADTMFGALFKITN